MKRRPDLVKVHLAAAVLSFMMVMAGSVPPAWSGKHLWAEYREKNTDGIRVCHNQSAVVSVKLPRDFLDRHKTLTLVLDIKSTTRSTSRKYRGNTFNAFQPHLRVNGSFFLGQYLIPVRQDAARETKRVKLSTKHLKPGDNEFEFTYNWRSTRSTCSGKCCGYKLLSMYFEEAPPMRYTLAVSSTPPGARVILSGKPSGTTPVDLMVSKGWYLIRVEKDGYQAVEENVRVYDEQEQYQCRLEPAETTPPEISIAYPETKHGVPVIRQPTDRIDGTVRDDSGIQWLKINGKTVEIDSDDQFHYPAELSEGENTFEVTASDSHGNRSAKTVRIRYHAAPVASKAAAPQPGVSKSLTDTAPPEIIITSPDPSRGIKVSYTVKKEAIQGIARDQTGIVEVTVNGMEARVDAEGRFAADVYLGVGKNVVVVTAMDPYQNRAREEFTIIREETRPASPVEVLRGNSHALVIGNNRYRHLRDLETARTDARDVERLLREQFRFETRLLLDAERDDIVGALNEFRRKLKEGDRLLIYYAGHGEYDRKAGKAYWLPVDAREDDDTNWIIVDRITSNIKRMSARHVLIVADSCYSGAFARRATTLMASGHQRDRYIEKIEEKYSRTLMASGGNEPVSDIGGSGRSVFAEAFIGGLKEMAPDRFTAEELYLHYIKERVAGNSNQTPEYNIIRNSGHDGGDFIFTRRGKH